MCRRISIILAISILINIPSLQTPYHVEGVGTIQKRYSILSSIVADIQEGQFLTPQIILNNIREVM